MRPLWAAEPWRVMALIRRAIRAALLPFSLSQIPVLLPRLLQHLQRGNKRSRLTSHAAFFALWSPHEA
jgi:hypothetical protein